MYALNNVCRQTLFWPWDLDAIAEDIWSPTRYMCFSRKPDSKWREVGLRFYISPHYHDVSELQYVCLSHKKSNDLLSNSCSNCDHYDLRHSFESTLLDCLHLLKLSVTENFLAYLVYGGITNVLTSWAWYIIDQSRTTFSMMSRNSRYFQMNTVWDPELLSQFMRHISDAWV